MELGYFRSCDSIQKMPRHSPVSLCSHNLTVRYFSQAQNLPQIIPQRPWTSGNILYLMNKILLKSRQNKLIWQHKSLKCVKFPVIKADDVRPLKRKHHSLRVWQSAGTVSSLELRLGSAFLSVVCLLLLVEALCWCPVLGGRTGKWTRRQGERQRQRSGLSGVQTEQLRPQ